MIHTAQEREIIVGNGIDAIAGTLVVPPACRGIVIFAHGSGSSRRSPRNRFVADQLHARRFGTLLMDLLTPAEARIDDQTAEFRFDVDLLARRLIASTQWCEAQSPCVAIGYFGASTGAAAALLAAASGEKRIDAIVSRGGRPDLAGDALPNVTAPTLLIVGERDPVVIDLNKRAAARMRAHVELRIIPRATHLFEESGTLAAVADLAGEWFARYLMPAT